MDLQQLRCFVVTAEELHFGRAAQKLGMMPSALGRHIKLLEEELATRLIDRTGPEIRAAAMTSATPSHRAMSAGRLSIMPFQRTRPSS